MPTATEPNRSEVKQRQRLPLATPTDLRPQATADIAAAMNAILADVFALYVKTKNFHWHMSGPHFRDYHLLLAEHREDNEMLTARLREAHNVCEEHRDVATASLIEVWIDETERRTWFLFEASQRADAGGH